MDSPLPVEEAAFLQAIAADRADLTRLLVFADWLDERSDPRAEFVRLHVRLREMAGTEPGYDDCERLWCHWCGGMGPDWQFPPTRLPESWRDAICLAFSGRELIDQFDGLAARPPGPVRRWEFDPYDHVNTSTEESQVFCWGAAADFGGPAHFWVHTLHRELWLSPNPADREAELGRLQHRPMTEHRWREAVRAHFGSLRRPPAIPEGTEFGRFLAAQQVYSDWSNYGYFAAFTGGYIGLAWCTTA